jgi:hypothetical protein
VYGEEVEVMESPFLGAWILNVSKSQFDANHRPAAGTMTFELDGDGNLLMKAEGVNEKGDKVAERPQKFIPDGKSRPVEGLPGLSALCRSPDTNKLEGEARREDGTMVGKGVYVISQDGKTLTATTSGFDSPLRQFEVRTVWDRA